MCLFRIALFIFILTGSLWASMAQAPGGSLGARPVVWELSGGFWVDFWAAQQTRSCHIYNHMIIKLIYIGPQPISIGRLLESGSLVDCAQGLTFT